MVLNLKYRKPYKSKAAQLPEYYMHGHCQLKTADEQISQYTLTMTQGSFETRV
jgi:hypothetical protein